jgi:hypothetical protein
MKNFLYWLPRVLSVLFIIFISVFALDAFGEPKWFLALIMHLVPSFVLIILTAIAWKNERLGGSLFIAAGLLTLVFSVFESLVISVPTMIIGILFLI